MMVSAIALRHQALDRSRLSSAARKVENNGKAVKIANAIVSIGTMASTVVKVRLPATCGNCSSSSRRRGEAQQVARFARRKSRAHVTRCDRDMG